MSDKLSSKTLTYMGVSRKARPLHCRRAYAKTYVKAQATVKLSFPSRNQVSRLWDKLFGKDDDLEHHVDEAEFIYDKKLRYDDMDSSMVYSIEYNPDEKAMLVGFRSDNALYMFYDVSEWIFDRIVKASSHGKMFWRLIRRSNTKYKRIR